MSHKNRPLLYTFLAVMAMILAACAPNASSTTQAPATGPQIPNTGATAANPTSQPAILKVSANPDLGNILVDRNGRTVYAFTKDQPGVSNCTGQCASLWPALTVAPGEALSASSDVSVQLGTIQRQDGSTQLTVNGMPVYYYAPDTKAGDVKGQGFGGTWYVLNPSGDMVTKAPSAASSGTPSPSNNYATPGY
jgi:predicted lipoprotein with Yx(FWY)xxD motif